MLFRIRIKKLNYILSLFRQFVLLYKETKS